MFAAETLIWADLSLGQAKTSLLVRAERFRAAVRADSALRAGDPGSGGSLNAVGKGRGRDGEKWLYALPRFAEVAARFAARERARRTPLAPRPPRRGSAQGRPGHGREVLRACCGVPRLGRAPSARDSTGRRRARSVRGALSLRSWPDESYERAFASTTCSTLSLEKGQCKPGGAPSTLDT